MDKQKIKTNVGNAQDRQIRVEKRRYGPVLIEAEFETVDGVELPEPARVQFHDDDRLVEVVGRNALATAHILAIAMSRNQIID